MTTLNAFPELTYLFHRACVLYQLQDFVEETLKIKCDGCEIEKLGDGRVTVTVATGEEAHVMLLTAGACMYHIVYVVTPRGAS